MSRRPMIVFAALCIASSCVLHSFDFLEVVMRECSWMRARTQAAHSMNTIEVSWRSPFFLRGIRTCAQVPHCCVHSRIRHTHSSHTVHV